MFQFVYALVFLCKNNLIERYIIEVLVQIKHGFKLVSNKVTAMGSFFNDNDDSLFIDVTMVKECYLQ